MVCAYLCVNVECPEYATMITPVTQLGICAVCIGIVDCCSVNKLQMSFRIYVYRKESWDRLLGEDGRNQVVQSSEDGVATLQPFVEALWKYFQQRIRPNHTHQHN